MDLSFLPAVNAGLNGLSTLLLAGGFVAIRRGRMQTHKRLMISAFVVSSFFLVTYVTHYAWRASATGTVHTKFNGQGLLAGLYYGMLISHILLAMAVPVLAIVLIRLGLKQRYATHKRIARWAWPVWMYVSVTGVLIYVMLYHMNPPAGAVTP